MRGISRVVLARDAAAYLGDGACRELGQMWNQHERVLAAAGDVDEQAKAAAARPLLEVCGTCPVRQSCREWAELDDYTGVAGGVVLVNGAQPRPGKASLRVAS